MAKLRKRGNTYFVDFRIGNKRIRKNVGKDKKLAEIALKDIEVRIARKDSGLVIKDYEIDKFFEEYLEYSKTNHSPSTFNRYRGIIDHYKKFLKDKPWISKLSDLNAKFFEDYKTHRKTMPVSKNGQPVRIKDDQSLNNGNAKMGAKTNTINMEIKTFRTILNMAIKWDYLSNNPMKGVTTLKVNDAKPPRFLTKEECEKLLEDCNDELYPIIFTFLHTGMRKAELENLEWQDIDFERRKIKIRLKDFWKPKTAEREIPISDELSHVLENLKKKQSKSKFVFCDKNGERLKRKLRRDLMRLTKKCGFPDVTKIHSLRHTFASHLVMNGVDLPTVQRLMGHTDIQTTMIYSHLAPDHLNEAVNKLNINGVRR